MTATASPPRPTGSDTKSDARPTDQPSLIPPGKKELRKNRARDRQYFAFRVGEYYFTGPAPDARTEAELLALADLVELAS